MTDERPKSEFQKALEKESKLYKQWQQDHKQTSHQAWEKATEEREAAFRKVNHLDEAKQ